MLPGLPEFLAAYPALKVQMTEGDRLVDLVREVDCVLRIGDLTDSAMVARRVALLPEVTCAAPAYLARRGVPKAPYHLADHRMVGFLQAGTGQPHPLELTVDGKPRQVPVEADVIVNSAENTVAMGLLGLGLIQVPATASRTPWPTKPGGGAGRLPADADAGFAAVSAQPSAVPARSSVHRLGGEALRQLMGETFDG
ncbi:LysR substrate-binding domain-containing protein [Caulobacter segnis]